MATSRDAFATRRATMPGMRLPAVDEADLRAFPSRHLGAKPGEMRARIDHADHVVVELVLPGGDVIVKTGSRDNLGLEAWACERCAVSSGPPR